MRSPRLMKLSQLVNIGIKIEGFLSEVDISTPQELQAVGPVEAWRRIKHLHPEQATFPFLCKLQGSLLTVRWNKLPEEIMEQLLVEAQADGEWNESLSALTLSLFAHRK